MKKLTNKQIATFIDERLESGVSMAELSNQLAAYLISERRARDLDSILRALGNLREKRGQVEITATTARSLPDSIKNDVVQLFKAKDAVFHENIDAKLIGGARFETQNRRLDLSLAHKLNQLKSQEF